MEIFNIGHEVLTDISDGIDMLKRIETAGRTCYKSQEAAKEDSYINFIRMLIKRKHFSVLEHISITVRFTCDRGVSHELVRHRLASFSQESTRFVSYQKKPIGFILPDESISGPTMQRWVRAMKDAEAAYLELLDSGIKPEIARDVLPNALKTEIVVTANLREWRTIFEQRTAKEAHPQMRKMMIALLTELNGKIPIIFEDIYNGNVLCSGAAVFGNV